MVILPGGGDNRHTNRETSSFRPSSFERVGGEGGEVRLVDELRSREHQQDAIFLQARKIEKNHTRREQNRELQL